MEMASAGEVSRGVSRGSDQAKQIRREHLSWIQVAGWLAGSLEQPVGQSGDFGWLVSVVACRRPVSSNPGDARRLAGRAAAINWLPGWPRLWASRIEPGAAIKCSRTRLQVGSKLAG